MRFVFSFVKNRFYFVAFAFIVNFIVFSFTQQEYNDAQDEGGLLNSNGGTENGAKSAPAPAADTVTKSLGGQQIISEEVERTTMSLERYRRAVREYDQAIQLNQGSPTPYYNKGIALFHLGNFQEAYNNFVIADQLSKGENRIEIKNNLALSLVRLGRLEEAVNIYREAIAASPNDYRLYNNMGIALNNLNRPKEALEALNTAGRLNPEISSIYNNRGVSFMKLREFNKAIIEYNKALHLDPYNEKAYNNRGVVISKLEGGSGTDGQASGQ